MLPPISRGWGLGRRRCLDQRSSCRFATWLLSVIRPGCYFATSGSTRLGSVLSGVWAGDGEAISTPQQEVEMAKRSQASCIHDDLPREPVFEAQKRRNPSKRPAAAFAKPTALCCRWSQPTLIAAVLFASPRCWSQPLDTPLALGRSIPSTMVDLGPARQACERYLTVAIWSEASERR